MAMTGTERSRVRRERRAHGKVVLTVVVGENELAEIAKAGYAEAASTIRKDREVAVDSVSERCGLGADAMTFERLAMMAPRGAPCPPPATFVGQRPLQREPLCHGRKWNPDVSGSQQWFRAHGRSKSTGRRFARPQTQDCGFPLIPCERRAPEHSHWLLAPRWLWILPTDQRVGASLRSVLRPSMSSSKPEN